MYDEDGQRIGSTPSEFGFAHHDGFPEVDGVLEWDWKVLRAGRFKPKEFISIKEARAVVYDMK